MEIIKERTLDEALSLNFTNLNEDELFDVLGGCKDGPCDITPCGWFTCPKGC